MSFRRILVPTDLSEEGERALAPAAELARALGAGLMLLHVVENAGSPPLGTPSVAPYLPGTEEEIARARSLLAARARAWPRVTVDVDVLVAPRVSTAIADYARLNGFDLVALSTHGRTGFRRLVMGSVAEELLRASTVPVLVFPRAE